MAAHQHPFPQTAFPLYAPPPADAQVLRAHILPLTNCAFNKSGDKFITGSYDRTCKVRRAFALADRLAVSLPPRSLRRETAIACVKTASACASQPNRAEQIWDTMSGEEIHTLEGHKNVVYAIAFNNPFGDKVRHFDSYAGYKLIGI